MEISQNIDWLNASKEDRAQLYVVLRAISDLTGKTIEEQMEEAFGYKLLTGADYLRNFRRGAIAKPKAKLIAAWIADHHTETAHTIAPELFFAKVSTDWNNHIQTHAIKGKFHIIRSPEGMGIVQRAHDRIKPDEILKLGEKFCFELNSDIEGYAIAFQGYRGEWYPLPLGGDQTDNIAPILFGEQLLPRYSNNKVIPLQENEDLGVHQFMIIAAADKGDLPQNAGDPIDQCIIHLNQTQFTL